MTPEEWLPVLAKRLDNDATRVKFLRRYMDGDAPLPEGRANVRESWKRFQRDARTNWGQLILEAVTDRIVPKGILVDGSADNDLAVQARRVWRDNRMDSVFATWLRYGLAMRQSYLTCWTGDDGRAVITADSPESMIVASNPLQPWRIRAAARFWRDIDRGADYAIVWSEDAYQTFTRPSRMDQAVQTGIDSTRFNPSTGYVAGPVLTELMQGTWTPDESTPDQVSTGRPPPVVVYNNPGMVGEYEPHLDVINRINQQMLDILSIVSMLAFRQRALKRTDTGEPLPQVDENGNAIDWAARLEYAPGALWDLPPGIDIWESQTTDILPLLAGVKDHIRQLSAVTRTPLPILMPDNTNTSAAGAISAETGYIAKCGARLSEAKIGGEAILVKALELEGDIQLDATVDLQFEPIERVSTAEKYQAAQTAKAAGQSIKSIQRDILGWGPDEIRQDSLDRADELLTAMTLTVPRTRQEARQLRDQVSDVAPVASNGQARVVPATS